MALCILAGVGGGCWSPLSTFARSTPFPAANSTALHFGDGQTAAAGAWDARISWIGEAFDSIWSAPDDIVAACGGGLVSGGARARRRRGTGAGLRRVACQRASEPACQRAPSWRQLPLPRVANRAARMGGLERIGCSVHLLLSETQRLA